MAQAPDSEIILSDHVLAVCLPSPNTGDLPARCFCPFHQGSTSSDLVVEPAYGRFHCIVCGTCGWTEAGWQRRMVVSDIGSAR